MDRPLPEASSGADPKARGARLHPASASAAPRAKANARAAGMVMAIAFALMALFNSGGLKSWARDLPEGWLADEAVMRADQWHALMVAWGPAEVRPAVHRAFDRWRELRWPGSASGADPEAESE
jgi:hypothetical protein